MKNSGWHDTYLGKIPIEWRYCSVADLIKDEIIERPIDGNHGEIHPKESDYVTEGIPFVMASDMEGGTIDFSTCKYITEKQAAGLRKGFSLPGDVLLSHKATLGRTAIVPELDVPYIMLTPQVTYYRVKAKDKLSPQYLHWFFRSYKFQRALEAYGGAGSTRAYIGITEQQELPIVLPSPTEQAIIAEILSSLDDKIELNHKQNRTLEAIAQALFKRWFVEFEFPDENGRPYKSSGGAMQPSELGEIPVGWEDKPLDQIAEYLNGLALQNFPPEGEEYLPVIKIREMKQGITANSDKASSKLDSKYVVDDGNVLFSWSGSLEVDIWCHGKGALNQHLFKVTSEVYPKWFYYLWTKHHLRAFQAVASDKATTMGHIQRGHLTEAMTVCPPEDLLPRFSETFGPLIKRIIADRIEARTLSKLRDTLLPKLMSGELRVA